MIGAREGVAPQPPNSGGYSRCEMMALREASLLPVAVPTPSTGGPVSVAFLPIIGPVFAYVGAFSSAVMVAWYCGIAYA